MQRATFQTESRRIINRIKISFQRWLCFDKLNNQARETTNNQALETTVSINSL